MIQPNEAQIYNWGIKKEDAPLGGGGPLPFGSASTGASSDASSNEMSSGPVAGTQGANIDSNAIAPSETNIRSTAGNSQENSSGRGSVEESGINNRTATELGGADIVFADGSISALSEERKITPETSEEARYENLKDRTIRPASVEYDKLGDTDTAAIYDGLSAAQMA